MIFIGGIQPKTVTVNNTPRLCPSCGLAQARLKRVDHFLSLFFMPLLRVRRGEEFVSCDRCGAPGFEAAGPKPACSRCGEELDASFAFCPYCGKPIHE